jgi:hypothetical protein
MNFYSYDENGYFIGITIGQKNPAFGEEGQPEYLQPGSSTDLEPIKLKKNKVQKFVDKEWILVDDPAYLQKVKDEEEAKKAKEQADKLQADLEAERIARQSRLETAAAKLKALGLTDDEIKAMIGV